MKCRLDKCVAAGMKRKFDLKTKHIQEQMNLPVQSNDQSTRNSLENMLQLNIWNCMQDLGLVQSKGKMDTCSNVTKIKYRVRQFQLSEYEKRLISEIEQAVATNFQEEGKIANLSVAKDFDESFARPDVYANQVAKFCQQIEPFQRISIEDQRILFKAAVYNLTALRISFSYDTGTDNMTLVTVRGY